MDCFKKINTILYFFFNFIHFFLKEMHFQTKKTNPYFLSDMLRNYIVV